MNCPAEFVALAERLADASGKIVRRYFRTSVEIITKADDSPVTIADRETETALRQMVKLAYPDHGLIGEEFPAERADAEYVWVFDPIDGTKSFITGRPLFGTLIALLHRGKPILGVIDHPAIGERWIGFAGRPTTFQGQPVKVRPCADLGLAVLSASSPHMFGSDEAEAAFHRVRCYDSQNFTSNDWSLGRRCDLSSEKRPQLRLVSSDLAAFAGNGNYAICASGSFQQSMPTCRVNSTVTRARLLLP